jgi:hypothetical protein
MLALDELEFQFNWSKISGRAETIKSQNEAIKFRFFEELKML